LYYEQKQSTPPSISIALPPVPAVTSTQQGRTLPPSGAGSSTPNALIDENRSSLHLSSGNLILLTDSEGHRTGYDTATGQVVQEIPNSHFSSEAVTNVENTSNSLSADYFIDVDQPSDRVYRLMVTADKNSSSYTLTMVTFSRDGTRKSADELNGSVISGSDKIFQINFVSAPNGSSTIDTVN
jgi:hypothetical protein